MIRRGDLTSDRLPLRLASELESRGAEEAWLIEGLWAAKGAGLLGAEPKCCKTWMALSMAVSVATGEPCLHRFAVPEPGPVLYFAAEDAEHMIRSRVSNIAASLGRTIEEIPVTFIATASREGEASVPHLHLDEDHDRELLRRCTEHVRPKLLVVDPFVRVTRSDENSSSGVGEVLGFLRSLQREFSTAVLLVHHMRKGGGKMRPGQALRGSGDLHAFGDSNLYLARDGDTILLTSEQRGAEGFDSLELELRRDGEALSLHALDFRSLEDDAGDGGEQRSARASRAEKVPVPRRRKRDVPTELTSLLERSKEPLTQRALREQLGCRMEAVNVALRELEERGEAIRIATGYVRVVDAPATTAD